MREDWKRKGDRERDKQTYNKERTNEEVRTENDKGQWNQKSQYWEIREKEKVKQDGSKKRTKLNKINWSLLMSFILGLSTSCSKKS